MVLFSDETKIFLFSEDRRRRVMRIPGKRYAKVVLKRLYRMVKGLLCFGQALLRSTVRAVGRSS